MEEAGCSFVNRKVSNYIHHPKAHMTPVNVCVCWEGGGGRGVVRAIHRFFHCEASSGSGLSWSQDTIALRLPNNLADAHRSHEGFWVVVFFVF